MPPWWLGCRNCAQKTKNLVGDFLAVVVYGQLMDFGGNMRKLALLSLFCVTAASQAIVVPIPFFATPPPARERFDTITAGMYAGTPIFSSPVIGFAYALNPPNTLYIGVPFGPPALTPPHSMQGVMTDVGIRVNPPMRRFGGFFRGSASASGVIVTAAKFVFYNQSGGVIGTQTVPLTSTWTWRGFMALPQKYVRVEIYGNVPGAPGGVEMDSIRVRPN
jgi:hypothetical protein